MRKLRNASFGPMSQPEIESLRRRLDEGAIPEPNSGCYLWTRRVHRRYGRLTVRHGWILEAHRAAWITSRGDIPKGLFVCHKCDVPICVNPSHLFLGTHTDNMRDMIAKGRKRTTKGEANPGAKLTEQAVREIRGDSRSNQAVARSYGVSKSLVSAVRNGIVWKDVV